MKKILSLTLAVLMVVSMIPTAFAAEAGGNWAGGTQVEATGSRSTVEDDGSVSHNAEYTITVPALLAPGGSGTVTLEGYWPSDATVKVTAEEKVEVVNDINSADKKELAVTFASIEKAGSNTAIVTASAPVSVANIENALFGKWAGKFNYNVEYNGEAGGSGTTEPSDPDTGDGEEITFYIHINSKDLPFPAESGMTWGEWVKSEYNDKAANTWGLQSAFDSSSTIILDGNGAKIAKDGTPVLSSDVIEADVVYGLVQ